MRVISRLNSKKQDLVEVARDLKEQSKVWLIFVPAKQQQKIYASPIQTSKTNWSARDLFWDQIQDNEGIIIDCRAENEKTMPQQLFLQINKPTNKLRLNSKKLSFTDVIRP